MALIETRDLWKTYRMGSEEIHALQGVSIEIERSEYVAIMGPSGSGKSTLMNLIGCLDTPSRGSYLLNGQQVREMEDDELARIRNEEIGFIFQTFNLVNRTTVLNNVLMGRLSVVPAWRSTLGLWPAEDREAAMVALERVGIVEKAYVRASNLSGGQQQRVGIARALAQEPGLMLADEPVTALDPVTSRHVMGDLQRINRELGITTVVNLHFLDLAREYGRRLIGLRDGEVVFDGDIGDVNDETFRDIYGRSITAEDMLAMGDNPASPPVDSEGV